METHEVTKILQRWREGDREAAARLFPLVYEELKQQARSFLLCERADHTLQPTALVHEAYLRLVEQTILTAENRAHFFAIAARLMRRILVDHARRHAAKKRGGEVAQQRLTIENIGILPAENPSDLLALDEVLQKLETLDQRKAEVVEMRFFGGLNQKEIAEILNVAERTVRRDWQFAKLWLLRELSKQRKR
jgi:RNA polymerase sigma-70 factor (ECF subfamily)